MRLIFKRDDARMESRKTTSRAIFRSQFRKTALCVSFEGGYCGKGDCNFAHGDQEIRKPPDLAKTSLCQKWFHGTCPHRDDCLFAHGKHELRVTEAFRHGPSASRREFPNPIVKNYLLQFVPEIFEDPAYIAQRGLAAICK